MAGIIPALAGNTPARFSQTSGCRDHPRSRGEYLHVSKRARLASGSSPLSRGILNPWGQEGRYPRIIPALAGNTTEMCIPPCAYQDHPRSRGEYPHNNVYNVLVLGSSPLSRGIRIRGLHTDLPGRIIPALAGNTHRGGDVRRGPRDHPRSRGEYELHRMWRDILPGSSPLSRGIPQVAQPTQ